MYQHGEYISIKKSFSALSNAFIDKSLSDNFLEEAIIKLVKTRVTHVDETNQECKG